MPTRRRYYGPVEALSDAILAGFCSSHGRKPGIIIERLSPETRERLRELTSDQALGMRLDDETKLTPEWSHDRS